MSNHASQQERENMYFSREQIEQSIKRLDAVNPFFGTTFLALKKIELPVGNTKSIDVTQIVEEFLQKFYRPVAIYKQFYNPLRGQGRKESPWKSEESYSRALPVTATRSFEDVIIHPKGSGSLWGWQANYVSTMKKHLNHRLLPAFDIAVWLFHSNFWSENAQPGDVIKKFVEEFHITAEEYEIFNIAIPQLAMPWLQDHEISSDELLEIIGPPPGGFIEGATLQMLQLRGVGPARREMEFLPAQRFTLITGDNGLGKSFLLECAWWALTGQWAGYPAHPREDVSRGEASILFQIARRDYHEKQQVVDFDWDKLVWAAPFERIALPGLTIFSRFDGSFTVWDPLKQLLSRENRFPGRESEAMTTFSRAQVWDGVRKPGEFGGADRVICNGLIDDWVRWQAAADQTRFEEFKTVLDGLSPDNKSESLKPGASTTMRETGDSRDIPTLHFDYGDVPILLCSSGIQRIVSLAYLLVWAWQEHVSVARSMRREPGRSIILLIDEVESHLHPFWQRTIVPSLMNVVRKLAPQVQIQLIMTTHSPLILASVETIFDEDQDRLFHLYQEKGTVQLENTPFAKRGRVDKWLMSDIFGLPNPRSIEAEKAIEAAKELQMKELESSQRVSQREVQRVSEMLLNTLAEDDDFWPRWTYFAEQRGVNL